MNISLLISLFYVIKELKKRIKLFGLCFLLYASLLHASELHIDELGEYHGEISLEYGLVRRDTVKVRNNTDLNKSYYIEYGLSPISKPFRPELYVSNGSRHPDSGYPIYEESYQLMMPVKITKGMLRDRWARMELMMKLGILSARYKDINPIHLKNIAVIFAGDCYTIHLIKDLYLFETEQREGKWEYTPSDIITIEKLDRKARYFKHLQPYFHSEWLML